VGSLATKVKENYFLLSVGGRLRAFIGGRLGVIGLIILFGFFLQDISMMVYPSHRCMPLSFLLAQIPMLCLIAL